MKTEYKIIVISGDSSQLNALATQGWYVVGFAAYGSGDQTVLMRRDTAETPPAPFGVTTPGRPLCDVRSCERRETLARLAFA